MATRALTAPPLGASTVRSVAPAADAPSRRRPAAAEGVQTVRPSTAGFYMAYLANGDAPPWPMVDRLLFGSTIAAAGICIAFGTLGVML